MYIYIYIYTIQHSISAMWIKHAKSRLKLAFSTVVGSTSTHTHRHSFVLSWLWWWVPLTQMRVYFVGGEYNILSYTANYHSQLRPRTGFSMLYSPNRLLAYICDSCRHKTVILNRNLNLRCIEMRINIE